MLVTHAPVVRNEVLPASIKLPRDSFALGAKQLPRGCLLIRQRELRLGAKRVQAVLQGGMSVRRRCFLGESPSERVLAGSICDRFADAVT